MILLALILPLAPAEAKKSKKAKAEAEEAEDESKMSSETFSGLEWRSVGPALMSGRIADIAVHPKDQSVWYVAVGSGNLWKTTNAGTTWKPVFDDQGSYSIGDVTLDPSNPEIVWVGTGENVGGRHVGYGDGVYKSMDGGASWENVGLEDSEHIGNIVVDPKDGNVVYVASQGPLWSGGGERGLFKTSDGGETWDKILGGGDYTGVNEVMMDPRDSSVLYAATHQRFRNVAALVNGGPESGIHKSTDGGATWRELENGIPKEDKGKIGLAISPMDPDVVYATIEVPQREIFVYRSADGGESWEKGADVGYSGTGPHYYQEIFASPHKFDRLYHMNPRISISDDGGKSWRRLGEKYKHGDSHAMAFDPKDPDYLLVGSDGGLYETWDHAKNWKFVANLPVTQFYKVAVDYDEPFYHLVGGTQDNNTQYGPSRTDNVHGIRNSDWSVTLFGDGHQPAIDPTDPNIIYSEWQEGNLTRFDRASGEMIYIQPQPEADEEWDRFNWDSPILISAHDPARLYFASQRVWRSDDRGDSWRAVSGDLSKGVDRFTQSMMGRVWQWESNWDVWAMSKYGTVTSLGESPMNENLLYAGTDDGLIQVSEDGGENWRRIDSLPGVPKGFFVNDIKADLHDADTVYVVVDDHKSGDFSPYVLKSTDRGNSWTSIASDLPERHVLWRIVQDHENPNLLFLGTEFGVFFTVDGGGKWVKLSGGMPNIPVRDLAIQKRENDLVAATFGRSFYILDDYSALRGVSESMLEDSSVELFAPRTAWWYMQRRTLGGSEKASQGEAFYTASNPPFGAVFTYYLKDSLETAKDKRQKEEKDVAKEGGDTPYPGWDALREEELEEGPAILLAVKNSAGEVVRRLTGPAKAGVHRVAWDLRYPSSQAWSENWDDDNASGFLVEPGTYTVSLAQRSAGTVTDLGKSKTVEVAPLRERGLKGVSPAEAVAFLRELDAFNLRADAAEHALEEAEKQLDAIKQALMRSKLGDNGLDDQARALWRQVKDLQLELNGSETRDNAGDPGPVSIERRMTVAWMGNMLSTYGPTPTHKRQFEIAKEQFAALNATLNQLLETDLPALEDSLDDAGVPWTPGRGVPGE
ncbi:MAG: glycosyl hydrolase [Thermoanaerobaculia bacterium]